MRSFRASVFLVVALTLTFTRSAWVGAAVTEMKSRPKNTPSTMPLAKSAEARGEASAETTSGKSRVPPSMTV